MHIYSSFIHPYTLILHPFLYIHPSSILIYSSFTHPYKFILHPSLYIHLSSILISNLVRIANWETHIKIKNIFYPSFWSFLYVFSAVSNILTLVKTALTSVKHLFPRVFTWLPSKKFYNLDSQWIIFWKKCVGVRSKVWGDGAKTRQKTVSNIV